MSCIVEELREALESVIERFPGNGRVTCRACDTTFREDDPLSHPQTCLVSAALAKAKTHADCIPWDDALSVRR